MSTEQLFKEFLKFYNTMNPMGMGATAAKKLRNPQDDSEAAEYRTFYNTLNPMGMGATAAKKLREAASPEGDSFADNIEERVAAAVEEDMLVEGVPAKAPTLEEMQSRNSAPYPDPPDAFAARVRDGMDIMGQKSRAREEAALAGDGPAPDPPDAFAARVRDGMDIMGQKSRAREEAALAGDGPAPDPPDAFAARVRDGMDIMRQKSRAREEAALADDAEAPTVEEMNSRNEEFGDSFDFMEGSEEYPAGRDKKSDRKSKRKGKEPLIATEAGRTIDEIAAPELQVDVSKAAKAEVISEDPEDYTDQAIALFRNTHGTSFDPKSRMDRGKLEKMKSLLAAMGGLGEMTPNQFALQVYRNY